MSAGILNREMLTSLANEEKLCRPSGRKWDDVLDVSSFDLPLGNEYWEMKGSCRAGGHQKVRDDIIPRYARATQPKIMSGDTVLQPGTVYVFKADCALRLAGTRIRGKATGKSSIGRLDVLVRLLADRSESFNIVPLDYEGYLYIEVTPITFPILVRPGSCLSQLRLHKGPEHVFTLTREALSLESEFPVVDRDGNPLLSVCSVSPEETLYPFSLDLTPDPVAKCSAFMAKKKQDLPQTPIDPDKRGHYDPRLYWESVQWQDSAIQLEMGRLYILRSKERLRIPQHLALECKSYTETMGEWRIEYAGFAHPYFGGSRPEGTPIIFEVRGHNIPTLLTDQIPLGNASFRRMSQHAVRQDEKGDYEDQELKLSKCFKPW